MQAIKEKLNETSALRQAKAEAKEEEKAEKELAKARMEVAHEVRLAREAEAEMDHHVNKAAEKAVMHERKYPLQGGSCTQDSYLRNPSTDPACGGAAAGGGEPNAYDRDTAGGIGSAAGTGYSGNMPGGPPTHNKLL